MSDTAVLVLRTDMTDIHEFMGQSLQTISSERLTCNIQFILHRHLMWTMYKAQHSPHQVIVSVKKQIISLLRTTTSPSHRCHRDTFQHETWRR